MVIERRKIPKEIQNAQNIKKRGKVSYLTLPPKKENSGLNSSGAYDNPVTLNIYPGIIKLASFSPGVWGTSSRKNGVGVRITAVWAPGVAVTGKKK